MFQDVRDPNTGKLLFRFDPTRDLVQIKAHGDMALIDLSEYRQPVATSAAAQIVISSGQNTLNLMTAGV